MSDDKDKRRVWVVIADDPVVGPYPVKAYPGWDESRARRVANAWESRTEVDHRVVPYVPEEE